MIPLLALVAASGISLFGCCLLFYSWKEKQPNPMLTPLAWLLLTSAGFLWIDLYGIEFGLVIGLTVPSLCALGVVWTSRKHRPALPSSKPLGSSWAGFKANAGTNLTNTLLQFVFAGLMAITLTSCVALLLPISLVNQLATIIFAVPVVWGIISVWLGIDPLRYRPLIALFAVNLSLVVVHLMD